MDGDREELRGIRNELASLRSRQYAPSANRVQDFKVEVTGIKENVYGKETDSGRSQHLLGDKSDPNVKASPKARLDHLMNERAKLLSSGLYEEDDVLIKEIEESILQIQAILAERGE